ncbi:CAAX prenyl protease [Coemansia sp. Benny D115]|nr:CAAX prenyl protease [Coemansia sp. Benny D115]
MSAPLQSPASVPATSPLFTAALSNAPDWLTTPSQLAAVAISSALGALYVIGIYLVSALFPLAEVSLHDRNHPHVIKQRIRGALLATTISLLAAASLLHSWLDQASVLGLLGLDPKRIVGSVIVSLVLVSTLYLGPLVLDHLDGRLFDWEAWRRAPANLWAQPGLMRNYVVGPVTEELVYRSVVVSLWRAAGISVNRTVFLSPLIFGFAHVHHALSQYRSGSSAKAALLGMLFQVPYTTLFGWFAAAVFIRTGSVWGPVAAHIFCNVQGLPDVGRIDGYPRYRYFIWLAFVSGLVGFIVLFEPMTRKGVIV